ncbi:MAG: galactose mutarotase [Gammaproteobacteria bacterium]|nr:galactose mutarotase [Gammaproteobacteria bacterium]
MLLLAAIPVIGMSVSYWGAVDGKPVDRIRLENRRGMSVVLSDYGAMINAVVVPDRTGHVANVALGFGALPTYESTSHRYGGVIGRYAGRIDHAGFALDHHMVHLTPGRNGVTLHGGPVGYDRRVWSHELFSDHEALGVTFRLLSPAGDQRFPGRLAISVTYRLAERQNALTIIYTAQTDAPTVVNLTNHVFFNLAGAGASGLAGQRFEIAANRYVEIDRRKIPDGRLPRVAGTRFDFLQPREIQGSLRSGGYDVTLVFTRWTGMVARVATVVDSTSGRQLDVYTTEPAMQFNSGTGFDGESVGSEGHAYRSGDGFSLETEHLPDSPNRPAFPSTVVRPGTPYRSETRFVFSIAPSGG